MVLTNKERERKADMVAENVVVLQMTSCPQVEAVLSYCPLNFNIFFLEKLFGAADICILYILLIEIIVSKKIIHCRCMIVIT